MKILITGAAGQLGYELQAVFAEHQLFLGDTDNFDITNAETVMAKTKEFNPDLIIHAAAYTNVDGAEANQTLCKAINVEGSANVAAAAEAVGAKLVAISTDYVFDGQQSKPYGETDKPNPASFYGQTKLEGEQAVTAGCTRAFICRTAWLYGGPKPSQSTDFNQLPYKNFVYTMLKVGRDREQLEVVGDQVGAPTYAKDLALAIKQLVKTDRYGIYHLTNSGQTNWADFAETIFQLAGYQTKVKSISSQQWQTNNPAATKRPAYSVLGHHALLEAGLTPPRSWQEAIADFLSEISTSRGNQ